MKIQKILRETFLDIKTDGRNACRDCENDREKLSI